VGQVKSKAKIIIVILFDIKGTVHKEFILTGQTVKMKIEFLGYIL
jgi:hypothetical protein